MKAILTAAVALLCAAVAESAPIDKAKLLYQNSLFREAKVELVGLVADEALDRETRSLALYMLGMVALKEEQTELAASTWRDVLSKFPGTSSAELAQGSLRDLTTSAGSVATGRDRLVTVPPSRLRLLSAGAEPKRTLRLEPREGAAQSRSLTIRLTYSDACSPGSRITPGEYTSARTVTVDNIHFDGPGAIGYSLTTKNAMTAVLNGRTQSPPPESQTIDVTVTPTGQMLSVAMPQVGWAAEQLTLSGPLLGAVEFPTEPVGPGARWEVPTVFGSKGFALQGQNTFFLQSLQDGAAVVYQELVVPPSVLGEGKKRSSLSFQVKQELVFSTGDLLPLIRTLDGQLEAFELDRNSRKKARTSVCVRYLLLPGTAR
jgi:hypothetical protein